MRKILFAIIIISFATIKANSQCQDLTFGSKKYPGICVENAIKWFNMSRANWTTEMQRYDFGNSGFSEGSPFVSSSDTHWDLGVQFVVTKGFDILQIENMPIGNSKKDIFQNIVGQLEPFFNRKSGNWNYFQFKYTDNSVYEFAINQSRTMDMIWIKKLQ